MNKKTKMEQKKDQIKKEEDPILVGYLNKKFGYNGFEPIPIGTPVYLLKDRYFFEMKMLNSEEKTRQRFYKESLHPCIDFKE